jgi:extracellular elastinolytic metalloproteinase
MLSTSRRPGRGTRKGLAVAALLAAALGVPSTASAVSSLARAPHPGDHAAKPYYDSRTATRTSASARPHGRTTAQRTALRTLDARLGSQAAISIDAVTGTPRSIQKLDGTLTGLSSAPRTTVAMDWIRANRVALGLSSAAVDALKLDAREISPGTGVTHLRYRQEYDGIPAFDNGVRVNLDRGGRIVNVTGSPLPDVTLASTSPTLSAMDAERALQRNVGVERTLVVKDDGTGARRTTRFTNGDFARLVIFGSASGPRLAWHLTYQATSVAYYDAVVDATTGAVLYRQNLTKFATNVSVFPNYPGADRDPRHIGSWHKDAQNAAITTDLVGNGWLASDASPELSGPFVHTYSDVNDDNTAQPTEEVLRANFADAMHVFPPPADNGDGVTGDGYKNACDYSGVNDPVILAQLGPWPPPLGTTADCAWDPTAPTSWTTNRAQNGVQAFYLANVYRDHLATTPIGFDATHDGFANDDPLKQETDDGAASDTTSGGPDGAHINNANMSTPPDGTSPRMQMYLFATDPDGEFTFRDINGGDDAGTVWHEYTHGLSNRLVTNDDGSGALSTAHAGAMGEAWSDWYALDFLHRTGTIAARTGPLEFDDPSNGGDVDVGTSTDAIFTATRFEPIDCQVGDDNDPQCPGGLDTGPGGYTFGDFGHVFLGPEVHSDGEIWMQTLWQIRTALITALPTGNEGSDKAEQLITEAMRLSPPEPSFLDERNAIIAADQAIDGGANRTLLWNVFANRGMGYFASVRDSSDVTPFENFDTPPAPGGAKGTIAGTVINDSGQPLAGVPVGIGGHTTDPSFPDFLGTTTDNAGHYSLQLPVHTYHGLVFGAENGYDGALVSDVPVTSGATTTRNVTLKRDWAGTKGGATVLKDPTKYDNTGADFGCGLDQLADQNEGTGISAFNPSSTDPDNPHLGPPTAVIQLPKAITVTQFGLDPSNTCGDDPTATTKAYTLETSPDGVNWALAKSGSFTMADRNRINLVAPTAGATNVRFVRLRALSPQRADPSQNDSGVDFIDFSEIEVYGTQPPTGTLTATPSTTTAGSPVTLSASFTDADGDAITGYGWDFDGNGSVDQTTSSPSTSFTYAKAGTFHPKVTATDARGGAGSASTTVTVNPGPVPPEVKPKLGKLPKSGKHGKVVVKVTCRTACKVTGSLKMSRKLEKQLKLKSLTAGSFKRSFAGRTAARKVTIAVSKKVARAARKHHVKTLTLKLSVTAVTPHGKKAHGARTVKIRL